jgi:DNA-binding response OmpR family regulator
MSLCPTCNQQISPLTLLVCLESHAASRFGQIVKLSPHEAVILDALVGRHPRASSMAHLASKLWGAEEGPENEAENIRVKMARLRRLVSPLGVQIKLRYKTGYRLVLDELPAMREVA